MFIGRASLETKILPTTDWRVVKKFSRITPDELQLILILFDWKLTVLAYRNDTMPGREIGFTQGRIQGVGNWGDNPPKTYESNFIHHDFVPIGKNHSRYKAILLSVVLSQQCCEVYFISFTIVNL